MNKIFTTLFNAIAALCFMNAHVYAQVLPISSAPLAFNYQAVARNASGGVIANQNISVKISIIDSVATGTALYVEQHSATTNQYGLFTIAIGKPTSVLSGSFANIVWAHNSKFIDVQIDPAGGTSYVDMGTTQLLSVPYALASADNMWAQKFNAIVNINSGNVGINSGSQIQLNATNGGVYNANFYIDNNNSTFRILSGAKTQNAGSANTLLSIDSAGDVGISASGVLPIINDNVTASVVSLTNTAGGYASFDVDGGSSPSLFRLFSNGTDNGGMGWDPATNNVEMFIYGNPGSGVNVNTSGNVGIGTTNPGAPLEVANGRIRITNNNGENWEIGNDGTGYFYVDEFGVGRRFSILPGGNVGVGTVAPAYILHVRNTAGNNGGNYATVFYGQNSTGFQNALNVRTKDDITDLAADYNGNNNNTNLTFSTRNSNQALSEKARIDNNGNLGIGITTPGAVLDVAGNFRLGAKGTVQNNLQTGQLAAGANTTGNNFMQYTITFPNAFTATPKVIVTPAEAATSSTDVFTVTVVNTTTTSCTVNVYINNVPNGTGWSQSLLLNYMAWQ